MAGLLFQALALFCLACFVQGQATSQNPIIEDASVLLRNFIDETTPQGTVIGRIIARDPMGEKLEYSITGPGYSFFFIDKDTGVVSIKAPLDYENPQTRSLNMKIIVQAGRRRTELDGSVIVSDGNDEVPVFTDPAPYARLSESAPLDTSVLPIEVTDVDTRNSVLDVKCIDATQLQKDACETFELVLLNRSNKAWNGFLKLRKKLDYESRKSYVVILRAFDGVLNVTNMITIDVTDTNDSPPIWSQTGPKVIDEEEPIGTFVQSVTATDPDQADKRSIFYELMNFNDVFRINSSTGVITNVVRLDYDDPNSPRDRPYDLSIKARELIRQPDGTFVRGNDPLTTADTVIKITVRDINDNKPIFYQDGRETNNFMATIDENIATGQNIPGLQMTVEDRDQTTVFNTFKLTLSMFNNVFGLIPEEDASSTSPSIFVRDSNLIDYEKGPREYVFQIFAEETLTNPAFNNTATVTIRVRDVNDETPKFSQERYVVNIPENALGGLLVLKLQADDPEEGIFGKAGIRYRLFGNIPEHFAINARTGDLTVKDCPTPGEGECIDYERKKQYVLTVSATDTEGRPEGETGTAQVIVNILDVNDNKPEMEAQYIRYIRELETVTINPLVIEAKDPDTQGGPVIYTLSGSDAALWQINLIRENGVEKANITAIRPILTQDASKPNTNSDEFVFNLIARDQEFTTTAEIIIKVIDTNNNAPFFLSSEYRQTLQEGIPGEVSLVRVSARDLDSPTTGNGIIDFAIIDGSVGKFQLKNRGNQSDGEIFYIDVYTTPDADFDFSARSQYNLTLQCRDRGTPLQTGSASVIISITDINNVDPVIRPSSTTINVREDTPIGTSVHQITAVDPDVNRILRYFMVPQSATQPNGANALVEFRNLFVVNQLTGEVTVNGLLNRDDVAFISNDLAVEDQGATPPQRGTGALFIRITEYNDQDPVFNQPLYNVTLDEERTRNSFVTNLECTDEDDRIAEYRITQVSPRFPQYFSLLPSTGVVIVNERIDFEQIEEITLQAVCVDSGQNPRSATSSVVVNIRNINDNPPIFVESFYRATVKEGIINKEEPLVTVSATDADKGDYGIVRYRMSDNDKSRFRIDEITGEIFILPGTEFDRETAATSDIVVYAYDSPNFPAVRRETPVSVYISIEDINDNCPVFTLAIYTGVVPESADRDTNILDILASDADIGINGQLLFEIQPGSGDPPGAEELFDIESRLDHGRLVTKESLRDKVGIKRFNVTASDKLGGNGTCTRSVPVEIDVKESQNDSPEWIRPPDRDHVVYVLESQYKGMYVYGAKAIDENEGPNGVVDYYFATADNRFVSSTPQFRINRVTGVIRAEIVYDREGGDNIYFLTLMARDRGNPAASSETTLTVVILDVDDNDPVFPMKDGVVIPLVLTRDAANRPIREDDAIGQGGRILGNCSHLAKDADSDHENNKIYYRLLTTGNGIENYITVDKETCLITMIRQIDFDLFPRLEFDILAYNDKNDDAVKRYKRAVNPSILPVVIDITDANNNPPVFSEETYLACASVDAPYRETILTVSATDRDQGDSNNIRYFFGPNPTFVTNAFGINALLGTIYNKISFRFDGVTRRQYNIIVSATDRPDNSGQNSSVTAIVFITDGSNLVRIKVNRPRLDVEPFKEQLISTIKAKSGGEIDFACIDSITNHVTEDGEESAGASDVFLMAAKKDSSSGQYSIIPASELTGIFKDMMIDGGLDAIYVKEVEVKGESEEFELTEDVILAILIICILLIFLAIILLCLACYCIRNSKKKKVRKLKAERHTVVQVAQEPVETSFNPVYYSGPESTEYATVKKTAPINPVVIPAPEDLQPLPSAQPTYLEPVEPKRAEPEEPEPVIETEVLPDPVPVTASRPQSLEHPEYEDRIETEIVDEIPAPPSPEDSYPPASIEPIPAPADDGEIEVEIRDSPPPSPASSRRD